jgi:hypothetical protein
MNLPGRPCTLFVVPILALSSLTLLASAPGTTKEIPPDQQTVSQLELRAQQAAPREQCFLYTELVHAMTELAGLQISLGQDQQASVTLQQVDHYARLIHLGLSHDTRRIKNAQMLMHHTAYRLGEYLHAAPSEDQPVLQATLKQLDQVQDELLNQVFTH